MKGFKVIVFSMVGLMLAQSQPTYADPLDYLTRKDYQEVAPGAREFKPVTDSIWSRRNPEQLPYEECVLRPRRKWTYNNRVRTLSGGLIGSLSAIDVSANVSDKVDHRDVYLVCWSQRLGTIFKIPYRLNNRGGVGLIVKTPLHQVEAHQVSKLDSLTPGSIAGRYTGKELGLGLIVGGIWIKMTHAKIKKGPEFRITGPTGGLFNLTASAVWTRLDPRSAEGEELRDRFVLDWRQIGNYQFKMVERNVKKAAVEKNRSPRVGTQETKRFLDLQNDHPVLSAGFDSAPNEGLETKRSRPTQVVNDCNSTSDAAALARGTSDLKNLAEDLAKQSIIGRAIFNGMREAQQEEKRNVESQRRLGTEGIDLEVN